MAKLAEFEFDNELYQHLKSDLGDLDDKAPDALAKAVNETAKCAREDLAAQAQQTYAVKRPRFKKAIRIVNAKRTRPTAMLVVTGRPLLLSDFKYQKNEIGYWGAGAKAKVLKSSAMTELGEPGRKAFVAKMKSGMTAIAQRIGSRRLPLHIYYGPSVPQMIGSQTRVYGVVEEQIQEHLHAEIEKQVDRILGR